MQTATTTCTFSAPVNLDGVLAPDYEYSVSTCVTTTNASSTVYAHGGFTYGEILISFFLLLIFSLLFFSELRNMIFKNGVVVRVIKEYDRKG